MFLHKLWAYINIFKRSSHTRANGNINLMLMHGINRLTILMFLVALVIIAIKFIN